MKPWLIIPAKPFTEAKSRLASVLSTSQRTALGAHLLARTLCIAGAAGCFAQMIVVSRDPEALALAAHLGALPLAETGADLNGAIEQACRSATALGAAAALILPADLPHLGVADLQALVAASDNGQRVVIAPSGDGGTNALLLPLPPPFACAFGPASYYAHQIRAAHAGFAIQDVQTATLSFDLDTPSDWAKLVADAPFSVAAWLAESPSYRDAIEAKHRCMRCAPSAQSS
jgi:2-phospho-L-lactate guanylyltransferase